MDLNTILTIKLKNDLINHFSKEFKELEGTEELDKDNLLELIDKKIEQNPITIDSSNINPVTIDDNNRCSARIMGERYSDHRCPYKSQNDSDYCKNHMKRIDNYGYLAFRRYDEDRPVINEKGNNIPWRDATAMEDINTVIQYQNMKLCKLIK